MKRSNSNDKHVLRIVFVVMLVIAMIVLYCIGSFAYVFAASDKNGVNISATGAAIYVDESNSYIWEYQGDKKYDPASTTKLLTCLIASEKLKLDDKITVTADALNVSNTYLFLKEGEKVTVRSLLHLALLESHNEAAKMLAIAVSGSEEEFAKLMDARAKQIGCTNCKFRNSTGLREPKRNFASAKDLCLITEEAFKNKIVKKICSKATYDLPKSNKNDATKLVNTNLFLEGGSYQNMAGETVNVKKISEIYGGKTGTTVKQKATMCVAAEIEGIHVYITILNDEMSSRYKDIATLVDYAKSLIQPYKALEKGYVFDKKAKVKNGAVGKVSGEAAKNGIINLVEGASASLVLVEPVFNEELTAPVEKGDVIGKAVIYLADEEVTTVNIIATDDVPEGWIFSRIGIPNSVAVLIMVFLGVVIGLFLVISILRSINRAKARARRKERIKEIAQKQIEREKSANERNWPYH